MRTLVEQLRRNLANGQVDAPAVVIPPGSDEDDLRRMYEEAPTAVEPDYARRMMTSRP